MTLVGCLGYFKKAGFTLQIQNFLNVISRQASDKTEKMPDVCAAYGCFNE